MYIGFLHYTSDILGFPKIDHSGEDARIVLDQHKFSKKKVTSNRDGTLGPRTVVCTV